MTAHYQRWLAWEFFITNVPSSRWTTAQVHALYRYRWRIEILFKALKGGLEKAQLLGMQYASYTRLRVIFLEMLIYALLVVLPLYRYFVDRMHDEPSCERSLSLLKFSYWLRMHLIELLTSEDGDLLLPQVARYSSYEKRHKRLNYEQLLNEPRL